MTVHSSSRRRLATMTALAALSAVVWVPPAGAQEAAPVQASSDGTVFELSLLGQGASAGTVHSEASTAPSASASGVGFGNPVFPVGESSATATADGQSNGSPEPVCAAPIPGDLPLLSLALVCSSSEASVTDGRPRSRATSEILGLGLNLGGTVADTPLSTVTETLGTGLDTLVGGLTPILGPIDDASGLGLQDTLGDLFEALLGDTELVDVAVGKSETTTEVTADNKLVTLCRTEGTTITVLDPEPVAGVDAEPVLQVILGPTETSVTVDLATGETTPAAFPAAVHVKAPALGFDLPVGPGQTIEVPLPEPLGTSTIQLAGPLVTTDENGVTTASAAAVGLHLLTGSALQGGIVLDLSACTSTAGAAAVAAAPPAAPPADAPVAPQSLPTTGGSSTGVLTVGVLAAGAALVLRGANRTSLRRP